MAESVRRFAIGRDRTVTRRILSITAALTVAAFGTLAVPTFWERYVSSSGSGTMQTAAALGFVLSVIASVYVVAKTANVNPYVPTAAVFVVLTSYGVTGVVTESQLVFFVGPSIFLGILVALSAYANDGALASLSLVFFPVLGYMVNAPYGIADGFPFVDRLRIALVFSLLFTLSIGIAGFLVGVSIRRIVDYADMITIEELRHEAVDADGPTDTRSGDTESDDE
ncbi:MAG: hypothetical protein ACOCP2_02030 [Halohasta sp.]